MVTIGTTGLLGPKGLKQYELHNLYLKATNCNKSHIYKYNFVSDELIVSNATRPQPAGCNLINLLPDTFKMLNSYTIKC